MQLWKIKKKQYSKYAMKAQQKYCVMLTKRRNQFLARLMQKSFLTKPLWYTAVFKEYRGNKARLRDKKRNINSIIYYIYFGDN